MNDTFAATQATAFTLSSLIHYRALQGSIGAGSGVTSQTGFVADASLIGASFNLGFRGSIPSGTSRYNLYMDGTAANYINGFTGFGTLNPLVAVQIGGDATYREFRTMRSGDTTTAQAIVFAKSRGTESVQTAVQANDTLGTLLWNGNDGSGSTVGAMKIGAQIQTSVDASVSTNIVPGRLAFFTTDTAGTTAERMRINNTGNIGIGTGSLGATTLVVGKSITGGTSAGGFLVNGVVQSDVTNFVQLNRTTAQTAADSFTLSTLVHYYATQSTIGAGSAITTQTAFWVDAGLTGGTNNYGFRGQIPSGVGRWNLFMDGTAANFLAGGVILNGNLGLGASGSPSYGTSGQALLSAGAGAVPTWGDVVTPTSTTTLTNKRITARVSVTASITSPLAWNSNNFDQYAATAQAGALTINADAGTPTDGQRIIFRFKDNGAARAMTWTTGSTNSFRAVGVTLPTTTMISKTVYVSCVYNAADSRWDAIAVGQEA
jgi:hypothetical protein